MFYFLGTFFSVFSQFSGVKFGIWKWCLCKRNDKYEVWGCSCKGRLSLSNKNLGRFDQQTSVVAKRRKTNMPKKQRPAKIQNAYPHLKGVFMFFKYDINPHWEMEINASTLRGNIYVYMYIYNSDSRKHFFSFSGWDLGNTMYYFGSWSARHGLLSPL